MRWLLRDPSGTTTRGSSRNDGTDRVRSRTFRGKRSSFRVLSRLRPPRHRAEPGVVPRARRGRGGDETRRFARGAVSRVRPEDVVDRHAGPGRAGRFGAHPESAPGDDPRGRARRARRVPRAGSRQRRAHFSAGAPARRAARHHGARRAGRGLRQAPGRRSRRSGPDREARAKGTKPKKAAKKKQNKKRETSAKDARESADESESVTRERGRTLHS